MSLKSWVNRDMPWKPARAHNCGRSAMAGVSLFCQLPDLSFPNCWKLFHTLFTLHLSSSSVPPQALIIRKAARDIGRGLLTRW